MRTRLSYIVRLICVFFRSPKESALFLWRLPFSVRGFHFPATWETGKASVRGPLIKSSADPNPLQRFFDERRVGRGIWKWEHYFPIYHRHLSKFRGKNAHVMEVGIFSGGSLDMWKDYFGPDAKIYGVDIQKACLAYADERTQIIIGDQGDRQFWSQVRKQVPQLDIFIDDGGHHHEQQIVTLEEVLPHLRPGGVYICEDVQGETNPFHHYIHSLTNKLSGDYPDPSLGDNFARRVSAFQAQVASVHFYPFVAVIEKNEAEITELRAPRHGTEWQPFL